MAPTSRPPGCPRALSCRPHRKLANPIQRWLLLRCCCPRTHPQTAVFKKRGGEVTSQRLSGPTHKSERPAQPVRALGSGAGAMKDGGYLWLDQEGTSNKGRGPAWPYSLCQGRAALTGRFLPSEARIYRECAMQVTTCSQKRKNAAGLGNCFLSRYKTATTTKVAI
jgi:hypothetical protein